MLTGGVPFSPVVWICAPIKRNGLAIRSIGRLESEASPVITESNFCAESIPESKRMLVPELPIYKALAGAFKPCIPTP